jgi:peptidoglycan/xylan/chitin deacetylase (PgdA/CDA1 family)
MCNTDEMNTAGGNYSRTGPNGETGSTLGQMRAHQYGEAPMTRRFKTKPIVRGARVSMAAARRSTLTLTSGLNRLLGNIDSRPAGILMYHRMSDPVAGFPPPTWNVTPSAFNAQMSGLLKRGFVPCSLRQLLSNRQHEALTGKSFVVTFDDGHESVYRNAWPILKKLGIPATVFLPTAYLDEQRPFPFDDWSVAGSPQVPAETWRPMTTVQCLEISENGLVELGAHTHTHHDFTRNPRDFERDLGLNIEFLRSRLDVHDPPFAFPFGRFTTEMLSAVRRAGLTCGLTTVAAPVDPSQSPFGWGRFHVEAWDTASTLASKLNGWYSWLPRLGRMLKQAVPASLAKWEPAK